MRARCPASGEPTWNDLLAQRDDPGGIDQPLHFHADGGGQRSGRVPGRGRSCGAGALVAEPGQVNGGKPGGDGLDPPPSDAQVHGGGVDPEPDLLAGLGATWGTYGRHPGHYGRS